MSALCACLLPPQNAPRAHSAAVNSAVVSSENSVGYCRTCRRDVTRGGRDTSWSERSGGGANIENGRQAGLGGALETPDPRSGAIGRRETDSTR